jgi:uncharacterized membrane protein YgcG
MRIVLGFLLAVALAVLSGLPAGAAEVIRIFDADIQVRPDGTLEITETITVTAEGNQIRRGVYRDIPVRTMSEGGLWSENGFELLSVERDGQDEPYHTEWQGRYLRLYLGQEEVFLSRGAHTYVIRYETTRQLRYFEDYDELYWNVTGNFWAFPILEATATVHLPEGAKAQQLAAYTGGFGESNSDATAEGEGTSTVRFATTRPLGVQEGMTIGVGFTKGVVAIQEETGATLIWSNLGLIVLFAGGLFVPLYYLLAWNRVGRDPPGRAIIPLFHPPEGMEPAAISFAHFNGFRSAGSKDLSFIAALLSLGVRKQLVIEEAGGGDISLKRTARGEGVDQPLGEGEGALYRGLLGSREAIRLDKANGKTLLSARTAFQSVIRRRHAGKYYKVNLGWFIGGLVLLVGSFILGMILQSPPDDGLVYIIPTLMTSVFGSVLLSLGFFMWSDGIGGYFRRSVAGVLMVLGALILSIGVMVVLFGGTLVWYRAIAGLLIFNVVFAAVMFRLLGAPTTLGVDILNRIEGFKLYLETAESNRLNMREAPEMTEELFERYLPYAAGLGVEEPWSDAWAAQLRRIAPERSTDYQPRWYHGTNLSPGNLGAATAASVAAVSSAMASAMPAPKSSSGSSGGGFSGGGGGGGGGGGW